MPNSAIIEILEQTWGILIMSIHANQLSLRSVVKDIARNTLRTLLNCQIQKITREAISQKYIFNHKAILGLYNRQKGLCKIHQNLGSMLPCTNNDDQIDIRSKILICFHLFLESYDIKIKFYDHRDFHFHAIAKRVIVQFSKTWTPHYSAIV